MFAGALPLLVDLAMPIINPVCQSSCHIKLRCSSSANKSSTLMLTLFLTLLLALVAGSASAQTAYIRQNNTNFLNTAGAWSPSGPPGSGDMAQWDATDAANLSTVLGGSVTWGKILLTNTLANNVTIGTTAGATLTLNGLGSPAVGIDMSYANKTLTINDSIILGASQTWNVTNTLTVGGYVISDGGSGYGLTKAGAGTMALNGTNTFSGPINISAGTLSVAVISNGLAASGLGQSSASATNLVFGSGATLTYTGSGATSDRSFTLNGSANLNCNGTGALGLTNTAAIAFGTLNQACTLTLGGSSGATITNILAAQIADNGSGKVALVHVAANNIWLLPTANTFSGGLTVGRGTLIFSHGALGTGTLTLGANGQNNNVLKWAPGNADDISSQWISGSGGYLTLDTDTNNVTFASTVNLGAQNVYIWKNGVGTLILNGNLSSGGALFLNAGTIAAKYMTNGGVASSIGSSANAATWLQLNGGTLQYIGGATVTDHNFNIATNSTLDASGTGLLAFTNTTAISPTPSRASVTFAVNASSLAIGNTAELRVGMKVGGAGLAANTTITAIGDNNSISISPNASVGQTNSPLSFGNYSPGSTITLTLTGTNTGANVIKGILQDSQSGIDSSKSALNITKTGVGQWVLSNANTYSGQTTISNGTLTVNGSLSPASAVTISGGTLAGSGTVQGVITNNGTITPGGVNTIGTFTLTNVLTGSGNIIFDLTNAATAGVTYDQINGGGTLQIVLSGPTPIQVNPLTGSFTNGTYYLITNTASLTGSQFVFTNGLTSMTIGASVLTLTNSSTGLILNVGATPPTQLVFTAVPANPQTGAPFSVTVVSQDAGGNLDNVTTNTTVTLSRGSGSGTLSGTLAGIIPEGGNTATISGVQYDTAETMTLTATTTAGLSLTAANTNLTFIPAPTKLAITSINGGSNPTAGTGFNVVVQSQDGASTPRTVVSNTMVSLSLNTGSGTLNTPLISTILAGASSTTITNVIYTKGETGVVLTATRNSGDNLTAGNSAPFNVLSNSGNSILTFSILGYAGTIIGTNITVTLPPYTVVTNLPPIYTVSIYATGSPASGTARNFSTPQTYTITAQDGSQQVYLVTVTVMTANGFNWTNTVSGNWSSASNWTNNFSWPGAPTNTGDATYSLNFNKTGTYTATNDLNSGFLLNQLNIAGPTLTLKGSDLAFTNNGIALPQINQNSNVTVTVNNNVVFGTNLTVGGTGSGQVILSGLISGGGTLIKNSSGTLTLNNFTNTYSGGTVISAGTVTLAAGNGNVTPFFGTGPVTINSPATLSLSRSYLTNRLIFNGGTVNSANNTICTLAGPITLSTSPTFNITTGALGITGNMSGTGGFLLTGGTTVTLSGSSTFTGQVIVNAGTLSVGEFNSVSGGMPDSNLGAPTSSANGTISLGSTTNVTLLYTGPGETTDRIIQLAGTTNGITLTQGGTGAGIPVTQAGQTGLLKFTSDLSIPGTAGTDNRKILTLANPETVNSGYVMGRGEFAGNISDSVLGNPGQLATSLTMAGTGYWTLSGSNSYSGTTEVQGGILVFTRAAALGTNTLDIVNGAKVELDFVGTRQIGALTFNGVAQPNGTYGSSSSIATTKDDTHFAGLGTVTVGSITSPTTNTLALTSGTNPSSGGALLTFTATVTGGNMPSGNVVFYEGLTALSTNPLNGAFQASFSTSILTNGTHTITAFYAGNSSNAPSASLLTQTVTDTRPATTTALALTGGANPSSAGAAVTFTATVTGAAPTGTVIFYTGTTVIGLATLNGSYQASLTTSNLPNGWNSMMAGYLGDANNAPSATPSPLWQTVKPRAGNGKLKVFILAGQSNMQGKGSVEMGSDPNNPETGSVAGGLGSLRRMLTLNTNKYGYLADTNPVANITSTSIPGYTTTPGWRVMTNVWVSYYTLNWTTVSDITNTVEARKGYLDADYGFLTSLHTGNIGPEYGFGLVVGSQLGDPVLIIKTAWGGTSLTSDWRPPSSGGTVGECYSTMLLNVSNTLANLNTEFTNFNYNVTNGYEIVGFGWHQGWNDIHEPKEQYETNLVNFIHDVRAALGVPNLPFAIDTTGMSSASGDQLLICAAQAAVANPILHPELAGTVFTVDTRPFDYGYLLGAANQNYHWYHNAQSYFNVGQSMGLAMIQLLSAQASVTNTPAGSITTNSAALNAGVVWPLTPCTGVVYWDTADHGTNAAAWANSAIVNAWTNSTLTYQYGWPGDYVLAGGSLTTLAATNLSFPAAGLTTNTTYYFTFSATNQTVSSLTLTNGTTLWFTNAQMLWAPTSQSFTTLSAVLGTPPTPVLSSGAITLAGNVPGFNFGTVSGYKYRLVFKNSLTDADWSPVIVPPNYPAPDGWSAVSTGSPISLTDTNITGQPQRFYRIEVANP